MPAGLIGIIVLFIVLGIVFSLGKGAFLISGYNTLSKEEKAKYDTEALCKFMGKSMFMLAFSVFLWGLSTLLNQHFVFVIGFILFIGTVIFLIIYTNTNNRFRK
ncbi:DUF3784 domain-containing protein [Clostridium folliculivorans]|uniref:DUF3784 domain-containing protein n=1 Tax=Clostridium folliculivorans TaxID=2886038 RepID=A0A9W6D9C3_9CLOT|nr:DUF3784 domain-containing protein [Clostridium folliculivorans]GKU24165.1 hypothetical protein CFOLD11_09910 [Clostridium folliculivorans]GKU30270.1 hypothetical protein CFB3_23770 [Clostridium folliculivorans]